MFEERDRVMDDPVVNGEKPRGWVLPSGYHERYCLCGNCPPMPDHIEKMDRYLRCNGTKRYALRCRMPTNHPSGLCHHHRGQTWADIRTEAGRSLR